MLRDICCSPRCFTPARVKSQHILSPSKYKMCYDMDYATSRPSRRFHMPLTPRLPRRYRRHLLRYFSSEECCYAARLLVYVTTPAAADKRASQTFADFTALRCCTPPTCACPCHAAQMLLLFTATFFAPCHYAPPYCHALRYVLFVGPYDPRSMRQPALFDDASLYARSSVFVVILSPAVATKRYICALWLCYPAG